MCALYGATRRKFRLRFYAELIQARALTQAAAAKLLGVDQPKVSALLRGRLSGFSTERLVRFLTSLGSDVEIVVRARTRGACEGHLRVSIV